MPSAFGLETLWAACGHAGIPGACLACGECPSKSLGLWRCSEKGSVPLQGQGWASVGNIHIDGGGWRAEVLKEGCSQRRPFLCARLCVQRSGDLGVGIKWEARWPLGLETWVLPLGAVLPEPEHVSDLLSKRARFSLYAWRTSPEPCGFCILRVDTLPLVSATTTETYLGQPGWVPGPQGRVWVAFRAVSWEGSLGEPQPPLWRLQGLGWVSWGLQAPPQLLACPPLFRPQALGGSPLSSFKALL